MPAGATPAPSWWDRSYRGYLGLGGGFSYPAWHLAPSNSFLERFSKAPLEDVGFCSISSSRSPAEAALHLPRSHRGAKGHCCAHSSAPRGLGEGSSRHQAAQGSSRCQASLLPSAASPCGSVFPPCLKFWSRWVTVQGATGPSCKSKELFLCVCSSCRVPLAFLLVWRGGII